MFEIIYISPSCKQAVNFIYDLVEKLKQNGVSNFETDMKRLRIKSDKFIVSAIDIFSGKLGVIHHMTEYYIDKVSGADYPNKHAKENALGLLKHLKCTFRDGTKEISWEELIEILMEI